MKSRQSDLPELTLKWFVASVCPYCPTIVPIVSAIGIHSQGKIRTEIIDFDQVNDAASKYGIKRLPHILVDKNNSLSGVVGFNEIMQAITSMK